MTKFIHLEERSNFTAVQIVPVESAPVEVAPNVEMDEAGLTTVEVGGQAAPSSEGSDAPPEPFYQVRQEGPVTYFRYYFDDSDRAALASSLIGQPARTPLLSPTLVGATVLSATALTGFFLANAATEKQVAKPTTDAKTSDSRTQQSPAKGFATSRPSAPEQIGKLGTRSAQKVAPPTPAMSAVASAPKLPPPTSLTQSEIAQALARPPIAVAPPERFGFVPPLSPPERSQPAAQTPQPPAPPPIEAAVPQPTPAAPIAPADLPSPPLAPLPTPQPLQSAPDSVSPGLGAAGSETVTPFPIAPETSLTPDRGPDAAPSIATPASMEEAKDLADPMTPTRQPSTSPQSIQDFVKLAGDKLAVSLMVLTQRAATEVLSTDQVGLFTVLKLSPSDYLNEWQLSSKTPIDATATYALPAHGFIDYQRQVIAVLQEDADSLKSATQAESSNSDRSNQPGVLGSR